MVNSALQTTHDDLLKQSLFVGEMTY